jgi:hypothetical protein
VAKGDLKLPADLVEFLRSGQRLHYPATKCEAGVVELNSLADLRLDTFEACCSGFPPGENDPNLDTPGCYQVPGVNLVQSCTGDYEPRGLLIWLPEELRYGVCDTDHDLIFIFSAEDSWSAIQKAAHRYINAQWAFEELDRAPADLLVPWPKYRFGR